jgi:predicted ABC-type exoprotein transport system permease subunit
MIKNRIHDDRRNSASVGFVTEKLGFSIKCCELALSSGSARTWEHKIKNAQKAHDTALRFVNRFELSEHETRRVNQRIAHLKTLLAELR